MRARSARASCERPAAIRRCRRRVPNVTDCISYIGLAKIRVFCYSFFFVPIPHPIGSPCLVRARVRISVAACGAPPVGSAIGAVAISRTPSSAQALTNGTSPVVVTSDASQNDVVICSQPSACNQCKTIGSGLSTPGGVATTNGPGGNFAGTMLDYVADSGNQRVVVFTDSCETVSVLDDSGYFPSDVAVARDGTVAVTNLCAAPSCTRSRKHFLLRPRLLACNSSG